MKKYSLLILGICLIAGLPGSAQAQDVFDLLGKGDGAGVKALIEKNPKLIEARDQGGYSLLHHAARRGNEELVRFLIDKGLDPDILGTGKKTPLHFAATNDRTAVVAALLEKKASVATRDDYGRTALLLCAREGGETATARLLIEAGSDVNAEDRFNSTSLELAAWMGKRELIDLLLDKGAKIPELGEKWFVILQTAASEGLDKLFSLLAEKSRDLKATAGEHLLHSAASGGSAGIIGSLLEKGYDPAKTDLYGWTPLHYAALDGRVEAARILIEKGAPIDARSLMGQTAYNVAREMKADAAASLLAEKGADTAPIAFPKLTGDYLGQTPPSGKAERFGLGIVSSIWGLHCPTVFSPDGNEVYWAPMIMFPGEPYSRGGLLMMKRIESRWTAPEWAPFSSPGFNDDVPFFTADGKRVYFISRRPLPGEKEQGTEKIWYADRTPSGWAEPKPLDPGINERHMHWNFSVDKDRNIYFAGQAPDSLGMGDIYFARCADGKYETPVNLGQPINSPAGDEMPFISRDGSYLLFARQYDIWVSFRAESGAWLEPVKLGPEVNGPAIDICPVVTDDGKYLFFLSQRDGESHVYWIGTEVIEKLRPGKK
ncbi:MAG: ankyrin repeat domain-containing protein [Candidatus Aminicenantes bacterium]|nr:ankyrin repeat domain-containing protein [Candidatus Aminicenantes bacterium]